ncbi:MAG: macro domain-containing protein [Pseudomonadota bacterium]
MNINYLNGDATQPQADGKKIVVHICNDIGKWGKGFVLAISKRWKSPEMIYKSAFSTGEKPELGDVQFVPVDGDIIVANIIGQAGVRSPRDIKSPAPIRYTAVRKGLIAVAEYALQHNASVHMPRIGCGLAGGRWEDIEPIIEETLIQKNIVTNVYDFS